MLKRRRPRTTTDQSNDGAVGTEAKAMQNVLNNANTFGYPPNGFFTRVEHSLLYAMIGESTVFPPAVVIQAIEEEEDNLSCYLYARPERGSNPNAGLTVSYAQWTALLALAGDEWPAADSKVAQVLCHHILKCLVTYADEHGLDRKLETDELLQPLVRHAKQRGDQAMLTIILPAYVAWSATMLMGNPLPILMASVVMNVASVKQQLTKEANGSENISSFVKSSHRMTDTEHASLLDE
jgi:hypothetical protein